MRVIVYYLYSTASHGLFLLSRFSCITSVGVADIVEPYPSIVQQASIFSLSFIPWCFAFCWNYTQRIEEVFPLTDVTEAGLSECRQVMCGAWAAPDTFYVKTKQDVALLPGNSHLTSIAIDAPLDPRSFIEEVNKQRKLAEPLPAEIREAYDSCKFWSMLRLKPGLVDSMLMVLFVVVLPRQTSRV